MAQYITDHIEQGLSRLLDQYKNKPRIEGMLRAWLGEAQEFSDQLWAAILNRLIDHAEGVHLRMIGKIVGQIYRGEDDERYRVLVRARVAANFSAGHINDLLRVASLVLGTQEFQLTELFPATVLIDINESTEFGDLAFEILSEARGGGVALTLHYFDGHDDDEALTWADGDEFEDDVDRGFGGDDPDTGDGGLLIGAF